jgi:predicted RNA-binding Zn ribbon-like protein
MDHLAERVDRPAVTGYTGVVKAASKSRPSPVRGGQWADRFIFIAGRIALDLTQTGGQTPERAAWEQLHRPADLAEWFSSSPLEAGDVSVTAAELEAALRLREAIWRTAQAIRLGSPISSDDIETLNRAAAAPDFALQLAEDGAARRWRRPLTAAAGLSTVARDAIDLFSSELRFRIRECENPKCSLLFVDASRPGRRRWCHMDRCGNIAKTARYRHTHR